MGKFILGPCSNCDEKAEHLHHVVPASLGGSDRLTNLVPLCISCHSIVHNVSFLHIKELQKAGIDKARERGVYKNRKRKTTIDRKQVRYLRQMNFSTYRIADIMNISRMSVHRILREGTDGKT